MRNKKERYAIGSLINKIIIGIGEAKKKHKSILTHTPESFKKGEVVEIGGKKVEVTDVVFNSFTPTIEGHYVGCFRVFYEEKGAGL